MNRYNAILLINILSLDACAKNPFDNASDSNYIELKEISISTTHAPLADDLHPQVPYQPLGASMYQAPEQDLQGANISQSTITYRMAQTTLDGYGCLLILKTYLTCCFPTADSSRPVNSGNDL